MIQVAKIIGTGLGITGLIGAGVGIGVVFGALIFLLVAFPLAKIKYIFNKNGRIIEWMFFYPPKPHAFSVLPIHSNAFFHLGEDVSKQKEILVGGKGSYLISKSGRKIFDASGGAAVSCLGHGNHRIAKDIYNVIKAGYPYASSAFWASQVAEDLAKYLINTTNGSMSMAYLTGSGSEATEAALKLARLYFYYLCTKNTSRVNIIYRDRSYHGNTLAALSVSGFASRKEPYIPWLLENTHEISACYSYRQLLDNESHSDFVVRKVDEFERKIQELGPETVAAFIAEPVVGAALGCVPAVPGYFKAMKSICNKYGILFIADEIMCGSGRTGSLHAWQQEEGFIPDIQTMAKSLGAGYQPIGAVLFSQKIVDVLKKNGPFVHGQTYEGMPVQATAALAVLNIIKEKDLVSKVAKKGLYLQKRLTAVLGNHPNVGDIRGRGFFWGIEFVVDKMTKQPFDPKYKIGYTIQQLAFSEPYNMCIYESSGTVDGKRGDHIMICPSFLVTNKEIDHIVDVLSLVIKKTFDSIGTR